MYMDKQKVAKILKIICQSIEKEDFAWRLDGSTNILVNGVDVEPKDIDIRTWEEGIKIFRRCLKKYIEQDFYNEKKKAESLILNILDEEVEINYYTNWNDDKNFKLKTLKWEGLTLKCISLTDLERMYRNIGRIEAADKLKKFLSSN
jgi:hypothetical protein